MPTCFFFNDTATTEIYTLSLHDALPIFDVWKSHAAGLPKPEDVYHDQALMMQRNFGQDQGVAVVYSPSGPLFEYIPEDRKSTRLNSSHANISYAVFCLKKNTNINPARQ